MTTFLWVHFVAAVIIILAVSTLLCSREYPRMALTRTHRWMDIMKLIFHVIYLVWICWLLFY